MLGMLRFLLAYLVLVSHLSGTTSVDYYGYYAVIGFFILSGYLITAALNDVYRFDGERFWVNRLLRLLPPYYVVCLMTLAIVLVFPSLAGEYHHLWASSGSVRDILMNFLVLPLPFNDVALRIVQPYWSVAIELLMYFLLWAFIARNEARAWTAFAVGAVYHVACVFADLDWEVRYFLAPSALMPFAIGSLVYFLKKRGALTLGLRAAAIAFAAWIANLLAANLVMEGHQVMGVNYYIGTACFAVLVAGLAGRTLPRLAKLDHWFGELAYPMFLVHWQVGFVVSVAILPHIYRGVGLIVVSTPLIILCAHLLAVGHRRLIEPLRARLRTRGQSNPAKSGLAKSGLAKSGLAKSDIGLGNLA